MIEQKQVTYTQQEVDVMMGGMAKKLHMEIQGGINKDLTIFRLNQKIKELTAQNNELRKAKTESNVTEKQKINDIP